MILGQFRQVIFEAGPMQQMQPMMQPTGLDQQIAQTGDPVEFKPLKKYLLVQKLVDLETKLDKLGLTNRDLNNVLKFANELSYETLVRLSNHIINYVTIQIQGVKSSGKK